MRYKLYKTDLCQNMFLDLLTSIHKYKFGHTSVDEILPCKYQLYKENHTNDRLTIIHYSFSN